MFGGNQKAAISRLRRRLSNDVAVAAKKARLVGASVSIYSAGDRIDAHYGVENIDTGLPVRPGTVHQIGSISKVFTATLIMQLVGDGRLTLDTPVTDIIPELKLENASVSADITVLHLITHTSGVELGDWQGAALKKTGRGDDCLERYIKFCADHLRLHPAPKEFPADRAYYHYSNIGFVLLGRIIEICSGRTWDDLLCESILIPLDLKNTTSLPEQAVRYSNAIGHITDKDGKNPRAVSEPYLARAMGPAVGRIKMTGDDLITFARSFLRKAEKALLPEKSIRKMFEPFAQIDDERNQGIGWVLYKWNGVPVFGHDGGVPGQIATLRVFPDHDIVVTGFFNGGNAVAFAGDFFPKMLRSLANIRYPEVPPEAAAHFAKYMMQGNYDFPGKDVEIIDGRRVANSTALKNG